MIFILMLRKRWLLSMLWRPFLFIRSLKVRSHMPLQMRLRGSFQFLPPLKFISIFVIFLPHSIKRILPHVFCLCRIVNYLLLLGLRARLSLEASLGTQQIQWPYLPNVQCTLDGLPFHSFPHTPLLDNLG